MVVFFKGFIVSGPGVYVTFKWPNVFFKIDQLPIDALVIAFLIVKGPMLIDDII